MAPSHHSSATSSPSSFGGNARPSQVSALSGKVQGLKFMQRAAALNPTAPTTSPKTSLPSATADDVQAEDSVERAPSRSNLVYVDDNEEHWSLDLPKLTSDTKSLHAPPVAGDSGWNSWLLRASGSSSKSKHRQLKQSSDSVHSSMSPIGRRTFRDTESKQDKGKMAGHGNDQGEGAQSEAVGEGSASTNARGKSARKKRTSTDRQWSLDPDLDENPHLSTSDLSSHDRKRIRGNSEAARYHQGDSNGARKEAKRIKRERKAIKDTGVSLQSHQPPPLVDYAASSDEEGCERKRDSSSDPVQHNMAAKVAPAEIIADDMKSLPKPLPSIAFPLNPLPNPKMVPGDWLCHVYIAISLEDHPKLVRVLRKARESISIAAGREARHNFTWFIDGHDGPSNLHVSLTQPVMVRGHEKEAFVREAEAVLGQQASFSLSFSTFTALPSSPQTSIHPPRLYYTLETGQGHAHLAVMSQALNEFVGSRFQGKSYFAEQQGGARFHASYGYEHLAFDRGEREEVRKEDLESAQRICSTLEEQLGDEARAVGQIRVRSIEVKVGKKITRIRLR